MKTISTLVGEDSPHLHSAHVYAYEARRAAAKQRADQMANEVSRSLKPGMRKDFRGKYVYLRYLIVKPRVGAYYSLGELDLYRADAAKWVAATCISIRKPELAMFIADLAAASIPNAPFNFTRLDAWRLIVDVMLETKTFYSCIKASNQAEAKAKSSSAFYTGKPCKHGKIAERRASDRKCLCIHCTNERAAREAERRKSNPDYRANRDAVSRSRARKAGKVGAV